MQREEWPQPEPIGRDATPPPFPIEVFPAWIGDFVRAIAASVQVPIDMPAMFALGALAAVTGGHLQVMSWDGFREACNLYIVVAMPPGSIKSAVHKHVVEPILRVQDELQKHAAPALARAASRRAVLDKRLKRAEDRAAKASDDDLEDELHCVDEAREALEELTPPVPPRLTVDDTTPEQLKSLLVDHPRLAMLSAESAFFGNVASPRYSKDPNLEAVLAAHPGDRLEVDRRGRHEVIDDPRLTICIAVQPTVLRKAHGNSAARERGLFARFLYSIPPSNIGNRNMGSIPPVVPWPVREEWSDRIASMAHEMRGRDEPLMLPLSPAATDLFLRQRASIEPRRRTDGDLACIHGWASKLDGLLLRLSGLLHVANSNEPEVGEEAMVGACRLADYFIAHAMIAFDVMQDDETASAARKVLNWITTRNEPAFSRGEAQTAFKGRLTSEELSNVLQELTARHYLRSRRERRRGGGRPATVYDVNPALLRRREAA